MNEKIWARAHLVPLLQAEQDRDSVRRFQSLVKKEAEIMKDVRGWSPMDLKAAVPVGLNGEEEPVYYTKRYVAPSKLYLPENDISLMKPQWWRGSRIFSKVLHSNIEPSISPTRGLFPRAPDWPINFYFLMIFAFVVDTSFSMNRKFDGMSYLDCAKVCSHN